MVLYIVIQFSCVSRIINILYAVYFHMFYAIGTTASYVHTLYAVYCCMFYTMGTAASYYHMLCTAACFVL